MVDQVETKDWRNGDGLVVPDAAGPAADDVAEVGTTRQPDRARPQEDQEAESTSHEENHHGLTTTPSSADHYASNRPPPPPWTLPVAPGVVQSPWQTPQDPHVTTYQGPYGAGWQPPGGPVPTLYMGGGGGTPEPAAGQGGFAWGTIVQPQHASKPLYMQRKFWVQVIVFTLGLLAVGAFVKWLLPLLINKVVLPAMNGLRKRVSHPVLALLIILAEAILPTFLMPTSPPGWLAGIVFRWGWGFLLVTVGSTLGFIPPFFLGRVIFSGCVTALLEARPKLAALMALPGRGGFWHQFRIVVLLRFSPIPYQILNYLLSTTPVNFWPYLLASALSQIPGTFVDIYTGIMLKDLADYVSGKRRPDSVQTVAQIAGIVLSVAAVLCITYYCRKVLKQLTIEDEVLAQVNMAQRWWDGSWQQSGGLQHMPPGYPGGPYAYPQPSQPANDVVVVRPQLPSPPTVDVVPPPSGPT